MMTRLAQSNCIIGAPDSPTPESCATSAKSLRDAGGLPIDILRSAFGSGCFDTTNTACNPIQPLKDNRPWVTPSDGYKSSTFRADVASGCFTGLDGTFFPPQPPQQPVIRQ